MKEQDKIPKSRIQRAGNILGTSARVGRNYLKYYGNKFIGNDDVETLQQRNADDIYNSLSKLKGGALKVAQMMSLDQGILPESFTRRFTEAQYSAPPLSYPLVVQTFRKSFGKAPHELYDEFSKTAVAAASIGQVHKAKLGDKNMAVKVQYPGVADSISSDLRLVKPIVTTLFNINSAEMDHYMQEVEQRLLEETNYRLELQRSVQISKACEHLQNLKFPRYYNHLSGDRILTMEWMEGLHLDEFLKTNPSQDIRDRIGQTLWDFYDFQLHKLHQVHADPHPGNFLLGKDGSVGVIDFGCVKEFSKEFHDTYFRLMDPETYSDDTKFVELLYKLDFLLKADRREEADHFAGVYREVHSLLCRPFFNGTFDFSDKDYFARIYALSEVYAGDRLLRKAKAARGPRDAIYLNRTYFGLYFYLHKLGASIQTRTSLFAE